MTFFSFCRLLTLPRPSAAAVRKAFPIDEMALCSVKIFLIHFSQKNIGYLADDMGRPVSAF